MKTKLRLLSLASLLSIGLLTGCGGDGKIHVVFWHTFGKSNQELLNTMIADFQKENPNIVIEPSSQGGYPEIFTKLSNAISSGDVPTMATCYADHVAEYLNASAVVDVSTFINDPELGFTEAEGSHKDLQTGKTVYGVDDYIEGYWAEGTSYEQEGVYSVPFAKSTEVLFYNADFFEKYSLSVPTTWDEMWKLCEKITQIWTNEGHSIEAGGDYEDYYALGYDSDSNLFITMCEQYDIPYTTNENIKEAKDHYLFNNNDAKNMVKELKSYYKKHMLLTKGSMPQSSYTSTYFKDGKIPMSVGSTGGTTYNDSTNFTVGIAPLPCKDEDHDEIISQGPSICFLRRVSQEQKEAAWKFYKHITNALNSAYYALDTGYDPVRVSSYETDYYVEKVQEPSIINDVAKVTATQQNRYFSSPSFSGSARARTEVSGIISTYFTDAKDIDTAFQEAYNNCILG